MRLSKIIIMKNCRGPTGAVKDYSVNVIPLLHEMLSTLMAQVSDVSCLMWMRDYCGRSRLQICWYNIEWHSREHFVVGCKSWNLSGLVELFITNVYDYVWIFNKFCHMNIMEWTMPNINEDGRYNQNIWLYDGSYLFFRE